MKLSLARAFGREPAGRSDPGEDSGPDAPGVVAPDAGEAANDAGEPELSTNAAALVEAVDPKNVVRRTVREISALLDETHHLREELVARGVQSQTINVLVEMAFNGRHDEREQLLDTAVATSEAAYGAGAITREDLLVHLGHLDDLEKDIQHARRLARQHGLDLQVLNFLTQIIRRHPGDGGAKALNTFFGYALACGVELDGIAEVTQRFGTTSKSVLPDVRRPTDDARAWTPATLVRDLALGCALAAGLLLFVS